MDHDRPNRGSCATAELVAQISDYAILALDGSGTIESWNAGACRLKGYSVEEAVGRSFSMFYTEADRRAGLPLRLLETARRKGRVEHEGWQVRRDCTLFWGRVVITALRDETGGVIGFGNVTRDLTRQHELEVSLRRSEERFRLLVSQVKDYAIIALDPSGTIESWNAGAERLKGYSAEEAVGRSFSMFYIDDDRLAGLPLELLAVAASAGRVEHIGWRIRKDRTRFWGDVVITALHDERGQLTGFVKVTRDLTERKQLKEAQASFLSTIGHDFRAPLTAIKGFTELVRDAPHDQCEEFLDRIDANADRLMQMMRDLVSYATLQSVQTEQRPEILDLAALARDAVTTMAVQADFERVLLPTTVALARVDRASMERVVINLVGNALKYAPSGPISVSVTRSGAHVRLIVADEGRGIDPEDLDTIFDEFQRGRLSAADGGTGVGLASVKRLVEEQGGKVRIESVVGEGTTVTVELLVTETA